MGFKDRRECPLLCKLASEYISKSEGCEDDIYTFFSNEPDVDSLFVKLVEEFERCILSYFAFHWSHADLLISQVIKIYISGMNIIYIYIYIYINVSRILMIDEE